MDSQKDEGPAPLLWRFSDFLKWSELCPSEPEIGHALMRLVITGQEIPHACEVLLCMIYFVLLCGLGCTSWKRIGPLSANRKRKKILKIIFG